MFFFNFKICSSELLGISRIDCDVDRITSFSSRPCVCFNFFWGHCFGQQKVVLFISEIDLILINQIHKLVCDVTRLKSISNIILIFVSNVITNFLYKGISDRHDYLKSWSLSKFTFDFTSHLHCEFFHVLVKNLVVELFWFCLRNVIIQLTTHWLNDVGFSWRDAICLSIFSLSNWGLDFLFVVPGWVLMLN